MTTDHGSARASRKSRGSPAIIEAGGSGKLDTSGRVECAASFQPLGWAIWADLDAFTQGYIEALFASAGLEIKVRHDVGCDPDYRSAAFSDLAPEALARIIADCGRFRDVRNHTSDGGVFYRDRQAGRYADFPPLTPYLGDDGRVYLRERK